MKNLSLIFLILTTLLLSGCLENKDETLWVVGTSADNPPYEFMQNGEIVGFDIDFITEIGRHLGKRVQFKNMEFHSLIAALTNKNVDIVIAALSVTKEREARVDFSIPYTSAKIAVLFRGEDNFTEPKDLTNKHVGAQLGSIWNLIAYDLSKTYDFKVSTLSNNLMLVEDLKSKRLDAVVLEDPQADRFIEIYPQLSKFTAHNLGSSFAVALPKNSENKKSIDHAIKSLRSNGTIQTFAKKWGLIGAE